MRLFQWAALAFIILTYLALPLLLAGEAEDSTQSPNWGPNQFLETTTKEGLRYFFAPMVTLGKTAGQIAFEGKKVPQSFVESVSEEKQYLLGYAVIAVIGNRVRKAFYETDLDDFYRQTDRHFKKDPKRVLVISSFKENSAQDQWAHFDFSRRLGDHPDATHLSVKSFADFVRKISALPQSASFDQIEIRLHGLPGKVVFADGNHLSRNELALLKKARWNIASKGAQIRVTSCNLGAESLFGKGTQALREIGEAFLPHGGEVFGSTKWVTTKRIPRKTLVVDNVSDGLKSTLQHVFGVQPSIEIVKDLLHGHYTRNPKTLRNSINHVVIEPRRSPASTCLPRALQGL